MDLQNGLVPANDPRPVTVKFLTRPLERDQIAQAYALIQSADPSVSLDRWTRFAHKMTALPRSSRHTGIMTVQTEAGYMCGLFVFEILEDLRHNRTLVIRHVFAISLVQREAIVRSLLDSAESLAHLNGCDSVIAVIDQENAAPAAGEWVASQFAANGFRRAGFFSAKPLGSTSAPGHPVLGKKT
jgi:hypothetical protein